MSGLITPDNHSGPTATMEHHLVKRILASLLLAACAFNANAQNLAPTVAITAPAADATVVATASVTLTAEAADSDGTIAKVEFYRDATLLATLTQAPYAYTFSADTPGSYSLTAKATDDLNLTTTSAAQTLTVMAPVAAPQVYYIFSDQINTAREITNANGLKVWQADPEPFGANLPNENPAAGQEQFTYNPRFPGQYYDRETGLHYNYYCDYDPQTGRYIQSDPIGLGGGINTYGYVGGNPASYADPYGLVYKTAKNGWEKSYAARLWNKFDKAKKRACIMREIRKRRDMCDILLDKLGSNTPLNASQQETLQYLNSQTKHDALIAVRLGLNVATSAATDGVSIVKGTTKAVTKAGISIVATAAGDKSGEDYASTDPNEWHVWTTVECEEDEE